VFLFNFDAHADELRHDIPPGALTVIGEEPEGNIAGAKFAYELCGSGQQIDAAVEHAVHIDEEAEFFRGSQENLSFDAVSKLNEERLATWNADRMPDWEKIP